MGGKGTLVKTLGTMALSAAPYILGVLTLIRTGREDLLGAVLLAPLYWVLMSLASARATIQLFVDPHHWEKTVHGLSEVSDAA